MRGWLACEARYERLCSWGASWESWQRRDPCSGVSPIGWKRWSRKWLYEDLGLFCDYRIKYTTTKVGPA